MKHINLWVITLAVILLLLFHPAAGPTGAHPSLQVTITPASIATPQNHILPITPSNLKEVIPAGLIFEDDFSDPTSGWQVWENDTSSGQYVDEDGDGETDEYHVRLDQAGHVVHGRHASSFSDFDMRAKVRLVQGATGGACGIVFRYQDEDNFYLMTLDIAGGHYRFDKRHIGDWTELVPWTPSAHINLGLSSNRVRIIAEESLRGLYVNDHHLTDVTDSSIGEGQFGLAVWDFEGNPLAKCAFDDFRVYAIGEPVATTATTAPTPTPTNTPPQMPTATSTSLTTATPTSTPTDIEYSGLTEQGRPIKFGVSLDHSGVTWIEHNFRFSCGGGGTVTTSGRISRTPPWPITVGSFVVESRPFQSSGIASGFVVNGTFTSDFTSATGTWQGILFQSGQETCRGHMGSWNTQTTTPPSTPIPTKTSTIVPPTSTRTPRSTPTRTPTSPKQEPSTSAYLPLMLRSVHMPTVTPTLTPTTPCQVKLYLRMEDALSKEPQPAWVTEHFLYPGDSKDWSITLTGDLTGNTYEFGIYLASSQPSTTFRASIILEKNQQETVLASTTFTASSTTYERFVQQVEGIDPASSAGDVLILRVTHVSGVWGAVVHGPPALDSYIRVPCY